VRVTIVPVVTPPSFGFATTRTCFRKAVLAAGVGSIAVIGNR
jgi:hypothetical protein